MNITILIGNPLFTTILHYTTLLTTTFQLRQT
jgi:hypothetical protein